MIVDADDFLKRVEETGKFKESFIKYDINSNDADIENYILIYEYQMDGKNYEVVIHKCKQDYVNYYIKII